MRRLIARTVIAIVLASPCAAQRGAVIPPEALARIPVVPPYDKAPADIQTIVRRQTIGDPTVTEAERMRVTKWLETNQSKIVADAKTAAANPATTAAGAAPAGMGQTASDIVRGGARGAAAQQSIIANARGMVGRLAGADRICAARPAQPARAPIATPTTSAQFAALIGDVVSTYGAMLPPGSQQTRTAFIKQMGSAANLANVAALAGVASGPEMSIYLLAIAAQRQSTPSILSNLGALLVERGDARRAVPLLEVAARAAPNSTPLEINLAAAYASRGDWTIAKTHYAKAAALDPQYAPARYDLGRTIRCNGDRAGGLAEMERAAGDWFDAAWETEIDATRAGDGLPTGDDAPNDRIKDRPSPSLMELTISGYVPARGTMERPRLPSGVAEYWKDAAGGVFTKAAARMNDEVIANGQAANGYRDQYAAERGATTSGASRVSTPSDDEAMLGLRRRRSKMLAAVGRSYESMMQDQKTSRDIMTRAMESIGSNQHPCPVASSAASQAYPPSKSAIDAHANRVDVIMQEYAQDANEWIKRIHNGRLRAAAQMEVAEDVQSANAQLFAAAGQALEFAGVWAMCAESGSSAAQAGADKPTPNAGTCSGPGLQLNIFDKVKMNLGCERYEVVIDNDLRTTFSGSSDMRKGIGEMNIAVEKVLSISRDWDNPAVLEPMRPITSPKEAPPPPRMHAEAEASAGVIIRIRNGDIDDVSLRAGVRGSKTDALDASKVHKYDHTATVSLLAPLR